MSASTGAAVVVRQPRRAVIERAWRAIGPGVEVLSAADGAPLSRTVKRIIDPLVLRLRVNAAFSEPLVTAEVAAQMHDAVVGQADVLRSTARWFDVLKRERRRLRITTGNAQELYFPVCYERAVRTGPPAGGDRHSAEQLLHDLHSGRDRTAIEALDRYLADHATVEMLAAQLRRSWADVRPGGEIAEPFLAGLATVLAMVPGHNAAAARQRVWSALVADPTPFNLGALAHLDCSALPWSIADLGLCAVEPQQPPSIAADRTEGGRPLDRGVVERIRSTLRRALDHDELPDIPTLCAEEVDRACAPWGLLAEDVQATLLAGVEIAVDLVPLDASARARYDVSRVIQARLRKEAYVLHARRQLAGGEPIHPRQQRVVDELAVFRRPYLGRLWARLHGRDVWQEACADLENVITVLEGVARSVSLDHRQRIKAMLAEVGAR
ncbi:MAG: hypothetical protein SW019_03215 [Actinomycetota bacterium]|nr:hypothetical protein [Actinomycetota bacterium]